MTPTHADQALIYSDGSVAVELAESKIRQAAVDLIFAYSSAYPLSVADKQSLQIKTIQSVERVMKTARKFRRTRS